MLTINSVAMAQNSCATAEEWSNKIPYNEVGQSVKYNGKLYVSKWYNKNEVPNNDVNGPWKFVGYCDGTTVDCSGASNYSPTKIYTEKGMQVIFSNNLYENLWYTKGKDPEQSDVWAYQGPCKAMTNPVVTANTKTNGITAQPYPFGTMPTNASMRDVELAYQKWKEKYVTSSGCPAGKRVLFDDMKSTVSEGMAYGLIVAGYMKDQPLFDDFYRYYRSYPDPWDMMHWKIDENGKRVGDNAATDADEDVAFMLLIAHENFGASGAINYLAEAKRIIQLMREFMVEPNTYVLKPGDGWGGSLNTNICYYVPSYYKIFAKVMNDPSWIKIADKCYEIIFKAWNEQTGLVPDWCQADGSLPAINEGKPLEWAKNLGKTYYYDATRTPWRIGMDYFWYGDPRADKYNKAISSFVKKTGFANIKDGYNLDGTAFSFNKTSAFVGPFGVGVMATSNGDQALVDQGYAENLKTFNDVYYNDMVRLIILMVQTGLYNIPDEYKGL